MAILDINGNPITSKKIQEQKLEENKKSRYFISSGGFDEYSKSAKIELKNLLLTNQSKPRKTAIADKLGLSKSSRIREVSDLGKNYPGSHSLLIYRALAWSSTVVFSIVTFRRNQLVKRDPILVPREDEPSYRLNLLDYSSNEVLKLPGFDEYEKYAIIELFNKIDPYNQQQRKLPLLDQNKNKLSKNELDLLDRFNKQHLDFHIERNKDKKNILSFLRNPDPFFSEESNWEYLLSMVLEDTLLLDRGVLIKVRNDKNQLIALVPVDGTTTKPVVNEDGFITSYVQVIDGQIARSGIPKEDVILFRMNHTPDVYMYGYGIPSMEVLYTTVLSDLFIDKGNLDYYKKGGSVPEGFLAIEPGGGNNDDFAYVGIDKETLDGLQRQIQSIIMSDFTQVPLISGGKFSWIDLKGTRRDMQFKELAEYLTRKICATFQVSPQDVGVLTDSNRSISETMQSLTKAKGLDTLASMISRVITNNVIDELRKEQDLKLWFKDDDKEAEKERATILQTYLNTGYKSINQALSEEGKDPVPWGDSPLQGLQNWQPPQPGGQGAPGIPGMQPGAIGQQQTPPGIPLPGQIPGQAPMLGQAPNMKSVISALYENIDSDFYNKELDVSGLVKSMIGDKNINDIKTELSSFDAAPQTQQQKDTIDIIGVPTLFLSNAIKKAGVFYTLPSKNFNLVIKIPESLFSKANGFKLLSYLFKFDDTTTFELSPRQMRITMYGLNDNNYPLPPIDEEGSKLWALTKFLFELNANKYNGTLNIYFVLDTYEFDSYIYEITENSSVEDFIKRIDDQATLECLIEQLKNKEKYADLILEKLEELVNKNGLLNNDSISQWFCFATDEDKLDKLLNILSTIKSVGSFYKNYINIYKKLSITMIENYDHIAKYNIGYNSLHDSLIKKYAKEYSTKSWELRREFFARSWLMLRKNLSWDIVISYVSAYYTKIFKIEESQQIWEYLDNIKNSLDKAKHILSKICTYDFLSATNEEEIFTLDTISLHLSELAREVKNSVYNPDKKFFGEEDANTKEITDDINDYSNSLTEIIMELEEQPFIDFETPLDKWIIHNVYQTILLISIKLGNYSAIRETMQDTFNADRIYLEFPELFFQKVPDVDAAINLVATHVINENDFNEETLPLIEETLKSILYGNELDIQQQLVYKQLTDWKK